MTNTRTGEKKKKKTPHQRRERDKKKAASSAAWITKLSFLQRFGETLIRESNKNQNGGSCSSPVDDYGQCFPVGYGAANTYSHVHSIVWKELSEKEKMEYASLSEAKTFRRFVNNTKYMFSPRNRKRELNLQNKRWIFNELQSMGFRFLPDSHCAS